MRFRVRFDASENYFARRESFSSIPASYRLRAFLDQSDWRSDMLYVKNVPGWERAVRFVMGAGLGAVAVTQFGATPIGYAVGAMGAMAAMSGVLGFCPACALVGRRLGN
jgi:hypothetical protein